MATSAPDLPEAPVLPADVLGYGYRNCRRFRQLSCRNNTGRNCWFWPQSALGDNQSEYVLQPQCLDNVDQEDEEAGGHEETTENGDSHVELVLAAGTPGAYLHGGA